MSGEHLATEIAKNDLESLLFQDDTVTSSVTVQFHAGRRTAAALSESLGLSCRRCRGRRQCIATVHQNRGPGLPLSSPWPGPGPARPFSRGPTEAGANLRLSGCVAWACSESEPGF